VGASSGRKKPKDWRIESETARGKRLSQGVRPAAVKKPPLLLRDPPTQVLARISTALSEALHVVDCWQQRSGGRSDSRSLCGR